MKIGASLPIREMGNDLGAIRAFAERAEELGLTHLRIPEQILRPGSGLVHEPLTLLAYLAGLTKHIELVTSILVLPSRQTALLAKQAAECDVLSGGRLRLGIGVGGSEAEYQAMGIAFNSRGRRCSEQLELLKLLWTQSSVDFHGEFDTISGLGLDPLPVQQPIPIWIGARSMPSDAVIQRIGRHAAGWFVLCTPTQYPQLAARIATAARNADREPCDIGTEAGVAVVGPRQLEWKARVKGWREAGLSHLCLRTLGGELTPAEHISTLSRSVAELDETR
jgi:probable F420-dependent oxidoreductase